MLEAEIKRIDNEYNMPRSNPDFSTISLWRGIGDSFFRLKDIKIYRADNGRHHAVIEIPSKGVWYEPTDADSLDKLIADLLKNIISLDNGLHINESAVVAIHLSLDSFMDDHGLNKEYLIQLAV